MTRTDRLARPDRWGPDRWRGKRWLVAGIILVLIIGLVAGVELWQRRQNDRQTVFSPGELVFSDAFERTVSKGWGETASGQTYVINTPADHSVFDGTARVTLPKARVAHVETLSGLEADDALLSVDVLAPPAARAGNGTYFSVQVRSDGSDYYRVQLRFAPRGQVAMSIAKVARMTEITDLAPERTVATGVSPGDALTLDVQVAGASPVQLQAGVRQPGAARSWQLSADDASAGRIVTRGGISLRSYLGGSTEAPKDVRLDNLQVWRLVSQTVPGGPGSASPSSAGPVSFGAHAATVGVALPDVGAESVGSAHYAVPLSNVIYVSPDGSDSAAGTVSGPLGTLAEAVRRASSGTTIVLRQGVYHESVIMPAGKQLTVQAYPDESVWLDGSSVVSGWSRSGSVWIADWNHFFDSSPTYTRGAPDGTEPGWQFVDPKHPMAAHPDQVWVGAARQVQVASRAAVTEGTFFVDQDLHQLVLGTDPDRGTVRASTLSKALTVAGRGSVVRGIGIRRYATSVWQLGALTVNAPAVRLENLMLVDNATTGLSVIASDARLNKITSLRNGMLGIHAHHADGLVATRLLAAQNNLESFNRAPVAGGMKITSSRQASVSDSAFVDNLGHGLWFDESCYRLSVTDSLSMANTGSGLVVEVSSRALLAGNTFTSNVGSGLLVINTDRVEVANNTVSNNQQRGIALTTGDRSRADQKAAADSRHPNDRSMVWITRDVSAYNNLVEGGGRCLVCVEDQRARPTPAMTSIRLDHNAYHRTAGSPGAFATWPVRGRTVEYPTFAAYRGGTGQDTHSREVDNRKTKPLAEQSEVLRTLSGTARPLSPAVAQATGKPAATRRIGAWTTFSS